MKKLWWWVRLVTLALGPIHNHYGDVLQDLADERQSWK